MATRHLMARIPSNRFRSHLMAEICEGVPPQPSAQLPAASTLPFIPPTHTFSFPLLITRFSNIATRCYISLSLGAIRSRFFLWFLPAAHLCCMSLLFNLSLSHVANYRIMQLLIKTPPHAASWCYRACLWPTTFCIATSFFLTSMTRKV